MLNDILVELTAMHIDRVYSATVYCGYGTTIEGMIDDYLRMGGSWRMIWTLNDMAYSRACSLMDEGYM